MRILLDENFPVQLHRRLVEAGHRADHIILLGQRGLPDSEIRRRLAAEADLVFLTQDTEFEQLPSEVRGVVVISRVPQTLRVAMRVELWLTALEKYLRDRPTGQLFEVLASGELIAWESPPAADGPG